MSARARGIAFGLAAAVCFGASTPIAKRLLDDVRPQLLAGLLYLGAFLVFAVLLPFRRRAAEPGLQAPDLPRLAIVVVTGGVVAPVLLLVGLERLNGSVGSLLLNLEGPFTLLLAVAVFGEHLPRVAALGAAFVFGGAALLTAVGTSTHSAVVGFACVVAACGLWAIDNNVTQSLTVRDPFAIVSVKTGVAAAVNVGIALVAGERFPSVAIVGAVLLLGVIAYGFSILFDAYALRLLGAAREAGIFAVAPFIGAVVAIPLLSERLGARGWAAAIVMAVGVALMLREHHEHVHTHTELVHEHMHVHDVHHLHAHDRSVDPRVPHSHPHAHEPLTHAHAHVSDVHHRHSHRD